MNRTMTNTRLNNSIPKVPAHLESLKDMEAYLRVIAPFDRVMIRVSKAGS